MSEKTKIPTMSIKKSAEVLRLRRKITCDWHNTYIRPFQQYPSVFKNVGTYC